MVQLLIDVMLMDYVMPLALKYLFGTCLNNFLINYSHTVLLLHICQCEAERWGDLKNILFGDVVLSVIGLGGAKNGSKKGAWHRN